MTKALLKDLTEAGVLPAADQDALAEAVLAEIRSEEAWEKAPAGSQDVLERLADEALAEHRSGRTKALNPARL